MYGAVQKLKNEKETGCILEAEKYDKKLQEKENSSAVSKIATDDQATKQQRTIYGCDWAEKQFKDLCEVTEVKTEEPLQSQDLETQEYTPKKDANMRGKKTE